MYGHLDVQPAQLSDGWDTEPFELTLKNGKLYGRGSSDDKGPALSWLHVVEAYQQTNSELPVNLKVRTSLDDIVYSTPYAHTFTDTPPAPPSRSYSSSVTKEWRKAEATDWTSYCSPGRIPFSKMWTIYAFPITIGWAQRNRASPTVCVDFVISSWKFRAAVKICIADCTVAPCKWLRVFFAGRKNCPRINSARFFVQYRSDG